MSAASTTLHCHELFSEIVEYLAPERPDPRALPRQRLEIHTARRTLAGLARLCRACYCPALDVLWRITTATALLSVLPTLRPQHREDGNDKLLCGEPTSEDWARLMEYARRVRELYIENSPGAKRISPTVWAFVAGRLPQGHVLVPRLQRLELEIRGNDASMAPVVLSSTIRHVVIIIYTSSYEHPPTAVWGAKTALDVARRTTIPHLDCLSVRQVGWEVELERRQTLTSSWNLLPYPELSHLRILEIEHPIRLSSDILTALAAFPRLQKLSMIIRSFDRNVGAGPETPLSSAFPALQELHLTCSWEVTSAFIRKCPINNLEELVLWNPRTDEPSQSSIGDTASDHWRLITASIRRFSMTLRPAAVPFVFKWATEMAQLTSVNIVIDQLQNNQLFFTENVLGTIVDAWPNLVEFEFSVKSMAYLAGNDGITALYSSFGVARPRLATLIRFVKKHPHLLRLTLPDVDTSAVRNFAYINDPTRLWKMVPQLDHGLQALRVCLVEERSPPETRIEAMVYDRLFPQLDLSGVKNLVDEGMKYEHWNDIEQFLVAMRMGRTGSHRQGALGT